MYCLTNERDFTLGSTPEFKCCHWKKQKKLSLQYSVFISQLLVFHSLFSRCHSKHTMEISQKASRQASKQGSNLFSRDWLVLFLHLLFEQLMAWELTGLQTYYYLPLLFTSPDKTRLAGLSGLGDAYIRVDTTTNKLLHNWRNNCRRCGALESSYTRAKSTHRMFRPKTAIHPSIQPASVIPGVPVR